MRRKHIIQKIRENFECQRCNLCCKVPGYVYLNTTDIKRIALHLKLTPEEFKSDYCEDEEGRVVLKSGDEDTCIFLGNEGCKIHEVKPYQCKTFPHKWRDEEAYDYCEGILKIKKSFS